MAHLGGIGGGNPEGKRALGRPRRRWEDNIEIYHPVVGWEDVD